MSNKYLNYVSDEHLLECVGNLHKSYLKAKNKITKKKLYSNKIDIIKLTFDSTFNEMDQEELIEVEILRQIDKSVNNSIGTFHEQVLGGIEGFQVGFKKGYDVKANDDTLFADIKNKHNTMNSSSAESLFQKLKKYADENKKANCYLVQILATKSFNTLWKGDINGKEYSHSRVYKISGDKFYELLTGDKDALSKLYKVLPVVIADYLKSINHKKSIKDNSAVEEIKEAIKSSKRTMIDQISFDSYGYYSGFEKL